MCVYIWMEMESRENILQLCYMSVSPSVMHNSMRRPQRSLVRSVEYWTWSQSFDGDSALVMSYFFATEEMSNLHRLYLQSPCSLLNINYWCIPCVLQARRGRRWTPLCVLHNKHCLAVFFAPHRRAQRHSRPPEECTLIQYTADTILICNHVCQAFTSWLCFWVY